MTRILLAVCCLCAVVGCGDQVKRVESKTQATLTVSQVFEFSDDSSTYWKAVPYAAVVEAGGVHRVVIADDHENFRLRMTTVIERFEIDYQLTSAEIASHDGNNQTGVWYFEEVIKDATGLDANFASGTPRYDISCLSWR